MDLPRYRMRVMLVVAIFGLILSACSSIQSSMSRPVEPVTLKIAVLPILEALPMYVAEQQGLFQKYDVSVEFVPVASAPERDQVISSGQADGMINEAASTMFYNKDEPQVQIVRFSRTATPDEALFRILASGQSGIIDVTGLKGAKIGISEGTVIEYLTDRLLQSQGFSEVEINKVAVPKIPDRLALLESGELDAGMLPEPVSSMAVLQGSKVILDDTTLPEISFSTITFRNEVIDQHPEAITAFLAAIEEAVVEINKNPNQWVPLLAEYNLVPAPLLEGYQMPTFVDAGVPSEEQWNDVLKWAIEKGFVEGDVPYADSVNSEFLPK